jgi:voltage-gated potassium channel
MDSRFCGGRAAIAAAVLRSWESALYFSASSYATVGYGDIVLPAKWRMLGPLESMIGVLMCGVSVSLLFAIATRLIGRES